jgi:hypothetical protein
MVQQQVVEQQLKAAGAHFRFFGRPEVRELSKIINHGETIAQAVNGYYEGGFALLAVTNHRVLLVDKKPLFLTLEDIRFDMVSQVDFNHRLLNSTIRIYTPTKSLMFTAVKHGRLRVIVEYIQVQVLRSRQHYMHPDEFRELAQRQVVDSKVLPHQQQQGATAIVPALGQMAFQGSNYQTNSANSFMSNRFIAPLSRNPYTKSPLMTTHRRLPGL